MKITLPRIVRERVGTAYTYPGVDRIYFAEDRPNVYKVSEGKAQPIYEPRLQYQTVFDYDFQFQTRAANAGRRLLFVTTAVAMAPLVVVYVAGALVVAGIERLSEALGDLNNAAGTRLVGFRRTLGNLIRGVINP